MSYPADTKSILVRERVLEILHNIVEGDSYFLTPGYVWDNYKAWNDIQTDYALEVFFGDGGEPIPQNGLQMEEPFTLIVHGRISHSDDPPGDIRKALRDVRVAILTDAAGGTLAVYAARVKLGATRTDGGQEASQGSGYFEQDFEISVSGLIETL
jgi:hypothetical protein